jgi:23S rRNA U2552 (ribose-2'-O)-methylase RlmE/FtsJ
MLKKIYESLQKEGCYSDKGTYHSYIDVYQNLFEPYQNAKCVMEIGVYKGESLRLWREFFKEAIIIGVDINKWEDIPGVESIVGNINNSEIIEKISQYRFDIIIDDASHLFNDQLSAFKNLEPFMTTNGLYIIEDIQNIDYFNTFSQLGFNCFDLRNIKNVCDDILFIHCKQ